jgi:hypothetical protein
MDGPTLFVPTTSVRVPAVGFPSPPESGEANAGIHVNVVFTSADATIAALHRASALASRLSARIILVVTQIVPFPLPLETPPVPADFNESRLRGIASQGGIETIVRAYVCRDRLQTLLTVLHAHSLVIVGSRKSWWPTAEARLARQLRHAGHEVILTEIEDSRRSAR